MEMSRPDWVIPATGIGPVLFLEREAVGIQFVDTEGVGYLVPLSGEALAGLGKAIADLIASSPAVLNWKVPKT